MVNTRNVCFLFILSLFVIFSCGKAQLDNAKSENEIDSVTDMVGYLNGEIRTLFVRPDQRVNIINALNATSLGDDRYTIPINNPNEKGLSICFYIQEVSSPYYYSTLNFENLCFENILSQFAISIDKIIEDYIDQDIIEDMLLATGDALGQLTVHIENIGENQQGGDYLKRDAKDEKKIKKDTKEAVKESSREIYEKLKIADKRGAREEAEKLIKKLFEEWKGHPAISTKRICAILKSSDMEMDDYSCMVDSLYVTYKFISSIKFKIYQSAKCSNKGFSTDISECEEAIGFKQVKLPIGVPGPNGPNSFEFQVQTKYFQIDHQPNIGKCVKVPNINSLCIEIISPITIIHDYSDSTCQTKIISHITWDYACYYPN